MYSSCGSATVCIAFAKIACARVIMGAALSAPAGLAQLTLTSSEVRSNEAVVGGGVGLHGSSELQGSGAGSACVGNSASFGAAVPAAASVGDVGSSWASSSPKRVSAPGPRASALRGQSHHAPLQTHYTQQALKV